MSRASGPALRWLRFIFYAGLVGAGLGANAGGIRQSFRILTSPSYWAPATPCLACAAAIFAIASGYAVWLSGATVAGWRMPRWVHLLPVGLIASTLIGNPLQSSSPLESGPLPPERMMAAMGFVRASALASQGSPCAAAPRELEQALAASKVAPSGYRRFGAAQRYRVEVIESAGPVKSPRPGDGPGTIYLACEPSTRRTWVSGVVSDALPTGAPTMVSDGVGRPAVLVPEEAP